MFKSMSSQTQLVQSYYLSVPVYYIKEGRIIYSIGGQIIMTNLSELTELISNRKHKKDCTEFFKTLNVQGPHIVLATFKHKKELKKNYPELCI